LLLFGGSNRVYTPDALQKLAQALVDDPDKELLGKDKQYLRAAVAKLDPEPEPHGR
jgi:hypothetical protein